ncbi:hypothetical protein F5888DRAFT_1742622 [Russula emetica]|nr:hypothetical protein F5888DRAFT_1742622 [Russula emetica]
MLSSVKPLFDKIDKYYNEVNVSLRVEEECLRKIHSSLRVTSDDRRRWEHIRDACNETFDLLTTGAPLPPPHMPQPPLKNKAARNIKVLAQTVLDARQSLEQARQDITDLTQNPQIGLLRLQSEYEDSKGMCKDRIGEVLKFSQHFLRSFVEIPPLDDFRDHLLPSAAESSSRILQEVYGQMKSNAHAVLRALPQLKGHFARFEHCLPIADASMQKMYGTLRGLVQPLEQPNNPPQGVFRTMRPEQLKNAQLNWRDLEKQWAAQLHL